MIQRRQETNDNRGIITEYEDGFNEKCGHKTYNDTSKISDKYSEDKNDNDEEEDIDKYFKSIPTI